jgi:FlaA1/EpsC-like NDP-sugar epimerase
MAFLRVQVLARDLAARLAPVPALRGLVILAFDGVASVCALYGALLLRFAGELPQMWREQLDLAIPLLVMVRLAAVAGSRLHRWSFKMSGLAEGARLVVSMLAATIVFAVVFQVVDPVGLPRAVYALEFFISASLMGALRFAPRVAEGWYSELQKKNRAVTVRTIIAGASGTGDLLARDLLRSEDSKYLVVGFVDDDPGKLGVHVSGKPVLGALADLPEIAKRHRISTVLLAIPHLPAARVRQILEICAACKVSFKTIPASYAYLDERSAKALLHDLSPDDLLPRDAVAFDPAEIAQLVRGRRALVTGAAGSIGGEICRQLAKHGVSQLVMVDMNENDLYLRLRRLQQDYPWVGLHAEVADIRELPRLHRLADQYQPEFVFHAAAHKHVPLMEDAPEEAVKNNVFGTRNVALMAHGCGAERLVIISTDKAVNPTSVMGATKRIAEMVVRDLARRSTTRMTAVRFGNVLGSAGSVVPLFKEQIERGGPVTLTHPDVTRYFMTISEAVGLVLLAGLGGYGDLCVLDMGEPIRIADLARSLITMAGRIPEKEIPIVYTGLRPGEKLHEELLTEDEEQTRHVRNRINVAHSPALPSNFEQRLAVLQDLADDADREQLLDAIQLLVPTYRRTPAQPISSRGPSLARPAAPPPNPANGGLGGTIMRPAEALRNA